MENWKEVENFEGVYWASDLGRIKSKWKILKGSISSNGYLTVSLSKSGKAKTFTIHRIIAKLFVLNPENKPEVNHKNEIKTDNRAENLGWMTYSENINYGSRNENCAKKKSKAVIQYDLEMNFVKRWSSIREAGRSGFDASNIVQCCKGNRKHKTHKNYIWKYGN